MTNGFGNDEESDGGNGRHHAKIRNEGKEGKRRVEQKKKKKETFLGQRLKHGNDLFQRFAKCGRR